jgi:hypothetical protein
VTFWRIARVGLIIVTGVLMLLELAGGVLAAVVSTLRVRKLWPAEALGDL